MIKRAAATIAALFLLTGMAAAQFATNVGSQPGAPPGSQVLAPAPSPAIGVGQIGVPTYVVPPAAPTTGGIINVGQIFGTVIAPYINELANDLVYAGMAYIFWLLKNKLNINIDAEHRATYTQAAQRQASSLIAAGAVDVQGKTITVDSQALAQAVNELAAAAPDALAHFGITPKTVGDQASKVIADRIVDMIPQTAAGAEMVSAAAAPAVQDQPKAA